MVDKETIDRHLTSLNEMMRHLRMCQRYSLDVLKKRENIGLLLQIEHALQIAIQNLLDIGAHLLASEGRNDWSDYRQLILKLGEYDVIPKEFAGRICEMAGFRNILVHEYVDVDVDRVHFVLQNELDDFDRFAEYVVDYLQKKEG